MILKKTAKHISFDLRGGLIETGGLLNFAKKMVSVFRRELDYKVEKLKYRKLEVVQPRIKIKPEHPVGE